MGFNWPVQFKTSLGPGLWAALLAVPVCILLLYFLKLKRQPVVISSTLLWRRSMEDLRVNSLFQRLRRNILM
ncbi:MAG: BatA domain-containing protein, partial [Isosphaeraceae bacterium]